MTAEEPVTVWAIVAHYGPAGPTERTLDALRAGDVPPDQLVVVDNQGDWDGADDDVMVVRPTANVGFAGAAAEGARKALGAGATWLWYVNNDALVSAACLRELLATGSGVPRAGILSPVISYPDGDIWYAGGVVDLRSLRVAHLAASPRPAAFSTGYVTGCAMLVRAAAIEDAGPPDASLFMYFEDVDLSLRMRERGWRLVVVPAARVMHDVERRRGRRIFSPTSVYLITRNRLVLAARRGRTLPALPPAFSWGLRQVAKAVGQGSLVAAAGAFARGLWDGLSGVTGPPPWRWT